MKLYVNTSAAGGPPVMKANRLGLGASICIIYSERRTSVARFRRGVPCGEDANQRGCAWFMLVDDMWLAKPEAQQQQEVVYG